MELLRELIQSKGLTLTDFAKEIKISSSTIDNWVNGRSVPRHNNLMCLAKFFGVPVEQLEAAFALAKPQKIIATIETPVAELPADPNEPCITRPEFVRAAKLAMERLSEIIGDSKSSMLAVWAFRADLERRLF